MNGTLTNLSKAATRTNLTLRFINIEKAKREKAIESIINNLDFYVNLDGTLDNQMIFADFQVLINN